MGQWCELPSDLLNVIDAQLAYIEKVRVRATCVSWNSLLSKMPNHKLPQLPWLLQTVVNNKGTSHWLFNLSEKKFYQLDLPEVQGRLLKGSTHGWLVMVSVEEDNTPSKPDICLINPLTGVQIQLPPRSTFPDVERYSEDRVNEEYCLLTEPEPEPGVYDVDSNHVHLYLTLKVITSSNPFFEDCVVVAVYGEFGELAWCARNHKKWTALDIYSGLSGTRLVGPIEDLIFSKNKLYALNCHGYLMEVENIGPNPKVTLIAQAPPRDRVVGHRSLVESSDGSLIMVNVYFRDFINNGFEAYKLDSLNSCWHLVNSVGNDMLFLGYNLSFSLPACHFPGYRGNCIYFTDNPLNFEYNEGKLRNLEIGVFNFEDASIQPIPGFTIVPRSLWPQPVFITPPNYHYI